MMCCVLRNAHKQFNQKSLRDVLHNLASGMSNLKCPVHAFNIFFVDLLYPTVLRMFVKYIHFFSASDASWSLHVRSNHNQLPLLFV